MTRSIPRRLFTPNSPSLHVHPRPYSKFQKTPIVKALQGCSKERDIGSWYTRILLQCKILDYSSVSGCYVIRPFGMQIWNLIRKHLDQRIQQTCPSHYSIQEASFPMLLDEEDLQKEAQHLAGFVPEVAWISQLGSDLRQKSSNTTRRLAIRPTSEAIIYPAFSKWIQRPSDLPLSLYQWCTVLRWEQKSPTPLVRSREIHWIEGHSAFATSNEASEEAIRIHEAFRQTLCDDMAVPSISGAKSPLETFAGADYSLTLETPMPGSARCIQSATVHNLGQNFSSMFDIAVCPSDGSKKRQHVWQTCWGFTIRTLGVCIMMHGDDHGLVLPPSIAPIQVIVVPVGVTSALIERDGLFDCCRIIARDLQMQGIRAEVDLDTATKTAGQKFTHWDLHGVCLSLRIGAREFDEWKQKNEDKKESYPGLRLQCVTRHNHRSFEMVYEHSSTFAQHVKTELSRIHAELVEKAKTRINQMIVTALDLTSFEQIFENPTIRESEPSIVKSPWCASKACEQKFADRNFKCLVIITSDPCDHRCIHCSLPAKHWALFGRSI